MTEVINKLMSKNRSVLLTVEDLTRIVNLATSTAEDDGTGDDDVSWIDDNDGKEVGEIANIKAEAANELKVSLPKRIYVQG